MKFAPLLLANLLRRKTRTLLTLGSFAVAVALLCLLYTVRASFQQGVDAAGADRLLVLNRVSLIQPLPLAYADRIRRVPGVSRLTHANWFGGVYQDPRNFFAQLAVDPPTWLESYPEFEVPEAQWQEFLKDRAGCVAGAATARRFGWKLGDRIPIRGSIYPGTWQFNLRGIYTGRRPHDDLTQFWFHWQYLEEQSLPEMRGYVGWYVARVAPDHDLAAVAGAIDALFANSAFESRSQTEKAWMAGFVRSMGNIELLMLVIGGVVACTLLLVTGNTMAAAVRERLPELAVLKTLGFGDGAVAALVLAESSLLAGVGGALGVATTKALTLAGDPTQGLLPIFYLSPGGMALGFGAALVVGLLAGLQPALVARQLLVAEALRRV